MSQKKNTLSNVNSQLALTAINNWSSQLLHVAQKATVSPEVYMQGNFKKQSHSKRQTRITTKVTPEAPFFFSLRGVPVLSSATSTFSHGASSVRAGQLREQALLGLSMCQEIPPLFRWLGCSYCAGSAAQGAEQGECCGGLGRRQAPGNNPNHAALLPYRHLQEFLQGKSDLQRSQRAPLFYNVQNQATWHTCEIKPAYTWWNCSLNSAASFPIAAV